jgi:DNA-binding CsgD family transcriptional regulator
MVNRNQIAIGTNLDGCFIFDNAGQLVQHFGRKEGMQDNNILVIFLDREKNLWFGLHNGIDFIPYNNAVRHINPASLNGGAGYTSQVFENDLYIGTSIGLYKFPIGANKDFSSIRAAAVPVRGTTGEVWNLSTVAGHLLMGHNEGAFSIQGDQAIPIDKTNGYWNFQLLSSTISSSLMIAGTYKGLSFYAYQNGTFTKIPGDAEVESARFVIPEKDRVWFSHPYKGIYAVWLKDGVTAVKKYTAKEGVASVNNNYLFKIKNTLLLTTEKGVFAYRPGKDIFEPSDFYNTYLPRAPIRYMKEDAQGNIWFVFEKKVAVLDLSTGRPHVIYLPELTNKLVAGFEHINPVDENNILLGGEKGFYNVNYQQYKQLKYPLQLLIGSVTEINHGDSLLFGGYDASVAGSKNRQQQPLILNHAFNSLHFEYASPVYGQLSNIEYSYYLEGFDNGWSEFSQKTEKDYTNLSPGDYVFKVKARSNLGNESAINEYRFTVLPPWYRTNAAYLFSVLLIGVGLYFFVRFQQRKLLAQQRRHDEEQRKLQYLHQLELEKAEKELVELRNQKLEAEILNKNTELASTAMHLVQKSDVLHKIKEQMSRLKEGTASEEATGDFRKILRTLNEENKIEEQWQQFSQHFDSVHHNFLSILKKKYPGLTPNEQKLCAYLKLNLSTKEIAQLMNISVRGVEISRYRLRKKLGIPAGMHLFNFLDEVG